MLVCDVASLPLFLSIPIAAGLHLLTMGHLLGVALGAGVAAVFFEAAYQVYLPSLVPAGQLAEGNAKLQGSEAAAQVAGPGAGGLLTQGFGAVAGVLADAATFAVSAACLLTLRHREPRPRDLAGRFGKGRDRPSVSPAPFPVRHLSRTALREPAPDDRTARRGRRRPDRAAAGNRRV